MKRIILLTLFLYAAFANAQVTLTDSFMHGGLMRTYRLYIPAVYNGSTAVPAVLNLHGYTSNGQQQELYGDFRPVADTANFIIAHPEGTFDASGFRFWNAFGLSPVDDIGFLSALIDTIHAHYNIDDNRIYSTGMSNGGFMSYLLACTLGNRIAAIASVTGGMTLSMKSNCAPAHATPVMQIHGTADGVVPYAGGGANLPVDSVVNYWIETNHCSPLPVYSAVPDVVPNDGCTAGHYLFSSGDKGSAVAFYKIIGGGHTWPGAPFLAGITNMDFNASLEIWRFFSQYKLSDLVSATENFGQVHRNLLIYPNPASDIVYLLSERETEKEVSVMDALGRPVLRITHRQKRTSLRLKHPGLYIIQVKDEDGISAHKLWVK